MCHKCQRKNLFHCAFEVNEYNKVSICKSAKEVWNKLEVTYEGTSQVKETVINLLFGDYDLF